MYICSVSLKIYLGVSQVYQLHSPSTSLAGGLRGCSGPCQGFRSEVPKWNPAEAECGCTACSFNIMDDPIDFWCLELLHYIYTLFGHLTLCYLL